MKKVKRVPRKIGLDDGDNEEENPQSAPDAQAVVKRPVISSRNSSKRAAQQPSIPAIDNAEEDTVPDPIPRQSRASFGRHFLQRNTNELQGSRDSSSPQPTYTADYLAELKNSTPSAPVDTDPDTGDIDVAAKFGSAAAALARPRHVTFANDATRVPSEAEIQEKKERRRRLAQEQEQDFISLNDNGGSEDSHSDSGDEPQRTLIIPAEELAPARSKYGESRLVHEDEDIAEGFDDFVEDAGRVSLGRKAAQAQEEQRKREMAEQIRIAQKGRYGADHASEFLDEGAEEEDDMDEDEVARNDMYEAAQTRAGTYGTDLRTMRNREQQSKEEQLKQALRFRKPLVFIESESPLILVREMEKEQRQMIDLLEKQLELIREEDTAAADEAHIKASMAEVGEKLTALLAEAAAEARAQAATPQDQENVPATNGWEEDASMTGFVLESGEQPLRPSNFGGMAQIPTDSDEYSE